MTRYLLSLGADVAARNLFGDTALHCAARAGRADSVEALLSDAPGATRLLGEGNFTGATPLHLAVMSDSEACVAALCDAGAPLGALTYLEEEPPSHFAVQSGRTALVRYLLCTGPRAREVDFTVRGSHGKIVLAECGGTKSQNVKSQENDGAEGG